MPMDAVPRSGEKTRFAQPGRGRKKTDRFFWKPKKAKEKEKEKKKEKEKTNKKERKKEKKKEKTGFLFFRAFRAA